MNAESQTKIEVNSVIASAFISTEYHYYLRTQILSDTMQLTCIYHPNPHRHQFYSQLKHSVISLLIGNLLRNLLYAVLTYL